MSGALRVKGRHARPVAEVSHVADVTAVRWMVVRRTTTALAGTATTLWSCSRQTKVIVAGATVLAAALTTSAAAFLTLVPARPAGAPKAAVVDVLGGHPAPAPAALVPSRSSRAARRGDPAALAFYEHRDPVHAAHVTEVIWTGPMLRVYTDLPASGADSKTAVALCETATAYALARDRLPAVFVHADREAGYPVLANKMGARDDCRLGRVP